MLQLKRLLVPRDGSECADHALDEALGLAARTGAEIHVLRVDVLHGDPTVSSYDIAGEKEKMRDRLQQIADGMSGRGAPLDPNRIVLEYHIERDVAVAPAILSYAEDRAIDLVVMGTHGRRGLKRLLLGSVAEEVVRMASCPVMTVHGTREVHLAGRSLQSILVPYDFSRHSVQALRYACAWASLYGARLELLHVVEEYLHPAFYNTGVFSIYDVQPDIEQRAVRQLEQAFRQIGAPGVEARFHALPGRAPAEIAAFATRTKADLIAMSTHGLTGVEHFLMGSVSEKVVRMAPCPVLTIKAFGRSFLAEPAMSATAEAV